MTKKHILILFVIFLFIFLPRFIFAGLEFNEDAHFWFTRSKNFYSNLLVGDFKETYRTYHPGVPIMWLAGAGRESFIRLFRFKFGYSPDGLPDFFVLENFAVKFPVILVISLALFYSFILIKKMFGKEVALIFLILLCSEPFVLSVDSQLHPDGLSSAFCLLGAVFALQNLKQFSYKRVSFIAIFLSLSFLTRSLSAVFIPAFAVLTLYGAIKQKRTNIIKLILVPMFVFCATYFLLFPAMWVAPKETFIDGVVKRGIFGAGIENIEISQEKKAAFDNMFYPKAFALRISPTHILLLVISVSYLIYLRATKRKIPFGAIPLLLLVTSYFVIINLTEKKEDRYIAMAMPYISLFMAILVGEMLGVYRKVRVVRMVVVFLITASVFRLFYYFPYYNAYFSEVFSLQDYQNSNPQNVQSANELIFPLANYFNSKDAPHDGIVVYGGNGEGLRRFYKGGVFGDIDRIPQQRLPDYFVLNVFEEPKNIVQCSTLEKEISFRGRTFWKVHSCQTN